MDLQKILLVLRARWWVGLPLALVTLVATVVINQQMQPRYLAETVMMVDVRPDPVAALLTQGGGSQGNLGTQVDIIRSDRVGRKVVKMLKLDEDPAVRELWRDSTGGKGRIEDWMAALLRGSVRVTPSRESNMLAIAYQGPDPVFVTAVANAYAQAYIEASVELKVEPARQYSEWFADQAKALRENLEKAQSKLSEFQRTRGITEEAVESEVTKLRELTGRLSSVQAEIRDAQSRQRPAGSTEVLPELMQNTTIQSLRANINQLEVKLKESAGNLGPRHPQFQRMQAELQELRNRLAEETKLATSMISSTTVTRTREADLRAAIDAQTRKVLAMRKDRDEIAVLARDVETAQRAYEAVTTRLTQTNLESQATRTNVSVLSPAIEPISPVFPMPNRKILPIALAAGLVVGLLAMIGLEFVDRRVRTEKDLAQMIQPIPVLAVIEPSRPKARRSRLALPGLRRRALPGPASSS